jgi:predicted amidohydrolase YtcJ
MKIRTYLTVYHHELAHDSTPKPGSTFGHLLHCKRVKILSDGALGSETAGMFLNLFVSLINAVLAMRYPYVGSENRGILLYTRERLHEMIKDGHEKGYQLEVHAIGDLAAEVRTKCN